MILGGRFLVWSETLAGANFIWYEAFAQCARGYSCVSFPDTATVDWACPPRPPVFAFVPQAFAEESPRAVRQTCKISQHQSDIEQRDQWWRRPRREERVNGSGYVHFPNTFVNDSIGRKRSHFIDGQLDQTLLTLLGSHLCSGQADLLLGYESLAFDLPHELDAAGVVSMTTTRR